MIRVHDFREESSTGAAQVEYKVVLKRGSFSWAVRRRYVDFQEAWQQLEDPIAKIQRGEPLTQMDEKRNATGGLTSKISARRSTVASSLRGRLPGKALLLSAPKQQCLSDVQDNAIEESASGALKERKSSKNSSVADDDD
ncbi:unnamed protein product, partial [Amoebophrya sp. A25]|eukprot:GSA25T00000643001.1